MLDGIAVYSFPPKKPPQICRRLFCCWVDWSNSCLQEKKADAGYKPTVFAASNLIGIKHAAPLFELLQPALLL
jgi:hypothetical protein